MSVSSDLTPVLQDVALEDKEAFILELGWSLEDFAEWAYKLGNLVTRERFISMVGDSVLTADSEREYLLAFPLELASLWSQGFQVGYRLAEARLNGDSDDH